MLKRLRDNAAAAGIANLTAVQAGAGEGRVPAEGFDRALLASVLGEIPAEQRPKALREIPRVLRPDGILYVVEVARFDPDYLAVPQVRGLLRGCGLSALKVTRIWPAYLMACRVERMTPR